MLKKRSYKDILILRLQLGWISNNQANKLINSSEGARELRRIRSLNIEGYLWQEKWIEKTSNFNRHMVFRLREVKDESTNI